MRLRIPVRSILRRRTADATGMSARPINMTAAIVNRRGTVIAAI